MAQINFTSLKRERPMFTDLGSSVASSIDESSTTLAPVTAVASTLHRPAVATTSALILNNDAVDLISKRHYSAAMENLESALRLAEQDRMPFKVTRRLSVDKGGDATSGTDSKATNFLVCDYAKPKAFSSLFSLAQSLAGLEARLGTPAKKSYTHRSEYDEGLDFFADPLRLEGTSRNMGATILFNLGRVNHLQAKYDKSLILYRKSLNALKEWHPCDSKLPFLCFFRLHRFSIFTMSMLRLS